MACDYRSDEAETTDGLVCGCRVQHDASGQGHAWRDIDADDLPAETRIEIECEIIDGGQETCAKYVARGGLHYRW